MKYSGYLVLESGEVFPGLWRGGVPSAGEVVFNTSHAGYEEIATDPSYLSQIVVMTAPMQGNYGSSEEVWESKQIWIQGFICLQMQETSRERGWQKMLTTHQVPIISDIDTRKLVLRLRQGGVCWGALVQASGENEARSQAAPLIQAKKKIDSDWVYIASCKKAYDLKGQGKNGLRVAVLDFGSKANILRELTKRVSDVRVFPSRTSSQDILDWKPHGVLLTNGPGDPALVQKSAETVRELLGQKYIFGICMGHQILALALGAKTFKLKFGHRGSNHPVKDEVLQQIYMTSQNHGYAVDPESLPNGVQVTHTNLNDRTVAGICDPQRKFLGVQFHPESRPGPHESEGLFDYFIRQLQ